MGMNRTMHMLHPSPFQNNRICKPSISQFSHQTIMKSANLYEDDAVGDGVGDKMIIDVIEDMNDDAEIDIEYDEDGDEYVTKHNELEAEMQRQRQLLKGNAQ